MIDEYLGIQGPQEEVILDLTTVEANAFAVIAAVNRALKNAGANEEYCKRVRQDMMSGDYDHLLQVAISQVDMSYAIEDD